MQYYTTSATQFKLIIIRLAVPRVSQSIVSKQNPTTYISQPSVRSPYTNYQGSKYTPNPTHVSTMSIEFILSNKQNNER